MNVATVIVHRNRPDLADHQAQRMKILTQIANVENKVLIVDCGSTPNKRTRHPYHWYSDPDFTGGKILGHIVGVELLGEWYDYYWLNHPDLIFNDPETLKTLIRVMEENREIGLLSPTFNGDYTGMDIRTPNADWHPVSCVEYLSLFIRGKALQQVGGLDPEFHYCVGADLDYGYRVWEKGWSVGFCDAVSMRHLGGTTYGAPGTKTPSREQYVIKSGVSAFRRLTEKYGEAWGEYMSRVLPGNVAGNRFMFCWDNRRLIPDV